MASFVFDVNAPPSQVWRVLGEQWGDVHRIVPSLTASRLVTQGPLKPGSRRLCVRSEPFMGMDRFEERLVAWDEGRAFEYALDVAPWPLAAVKNRCELEPNAAGTRVTMTPSVRMRGGVAAQWLAPAFARLLIFASRKDLQLMADAIERECAQLPAVR